MSVNSSVSAYPSNCVWIFTSEFHVLPMEAFCSTTVRTYRCICLSISKCLWYHRVSIHCKFEWYWAEGFEEQSPISAEVQFKFHPHEVLRAADAVTEQVGDEPLTLIGSREIPQENTDGVLRNGHRGTISWIRFILSNDDAIFCIIDKSTYRWSSCLESRWNKT